MTVKLSEAQRHFLQALEAAGGMNVDPPSLRLIPEELYREDDRARQQCKRLGFAEPVKPRSTRWNLLPAGRAALKESENG